MFSFILKSINRDDEPPSESSSAVVESQQEAVGGNVTETSKDEIRRLRLQKLSLGSHKSAGSEGAGEDVKRAKLSFPPTMDGQPSVFMDVESASSPTGQTDAIDSSPALSSDNTSSFVA